MTKNPAQRPGLRERLSERRARSRKRLETNPILRILGGRGAATILLGGALSLGGLTEAVSGSHVRLQQDSGTLNLVNEKGSRSTVLAHFHDGFAADSVLKLVRILPSRFISHNKPLFDEGWMQSGDSRDLFHEEMARINVSIRQDFFANAMPFGDLIHEKALKYDVDPSLVAAVIETESKFQQHARSQMGARGLMQLMPSTGRWMGAGNLYDAEQNIDAGVKYIKYLQERFHGNLKQTIAAYNAGEGNVRRYNGVPPFRETQSYVRNVMRRYQKRSQQLQQYGAEHGGAVGSDVVEPPMTAVR